MFFEKAPPDQGGDFELPLLVYVMERNSMIKRLLTLFALVLGGSAKAREIENYIGEVMHQVDPEEMKKRLADRERVFDAWTRSSPFTVKKQLTAEDIQKKLAAAARRREAVSRFGFSSSVTDSLLPSGAYKA
jgi:hypothetical protein